MKVFQAWSQEERVYDGAHEMSEPVMTITVEDVLWAMYTVNAKLTDENLERALASMCDFDCRVTDLLEGIVDCMNLESEEQ